jgi:predicted house-cleaning noncanonical NTP pyrophosphatase (MazG superfamily)
MNRGKLVRDKIPQIIRSRGGDPLVRVAEREKYRDLLRAKLTEEVTEFLDSDDPEELGDILEVVLTLASELGMDAARLEALRAKKAAERGGLSGGSSGTATEKPRSPRRPINSLSRALSWLDEKSLAGRRHW